MNIASLAIQDIYIQDIIFRKISVNEATLLIHNTHHSYTLHIELSPFAGA